MTFDRSTQARELLEVLRPRLPHFLVLLALTIVIPVYVAYSLPEIYRSTATVLVKEQEIPIDLVDPYESTAIEKELLLLQRRVLSTDNLAALIEDLNLFSAQREAGTPPADLAGTLRRSISVEPIRKEMAHPTSGKLVFVTTSFRISVDHPSAETATRIAQRIAEAFIAEDRKNRDSRVKVTSSFVEREAQRLRERVAQSEQELARFKKEHIDLLPEYAFGNRERIDQLRDEIDELQSDISALENERRYLNEQIRNNDPLKQARAELEDAKRRYSDLHPDVVRLRNIVKQMEKDPSRGLTPSDPGYANYMNLRADLQKVSAELRGKRVKLRRLEDAIDELKSSLSQAPEVERKYTALQRQHQIAVQAYEEFREKAIRARMADQLAESEMAEKLALMAPATSLRDPVSPNKPAIILLGVTFGIGICLAYAGLLAYADHRVWGPKRLERAMGAPPIGIIPSFRSHTGYRAYAAIFSLAIVLALAAFLALKGNKILP